MLGQVARELGELATLEQRHRRPDTRVPDGRAREVIGPALERDFSTVKELGRPTPALAGSLLAGVLVAVAWLASLQFPSLPRLVTIVLAGAAGFSIGVGSGKAAPKGAWPLSRAENAPDLLEASTTWSDACGRRRTVDLLTAHRFRAIRNTWRRPRAPRGGE